MRRVEAVSGVQLPEQKRSLVESRLVRRALKLGHRDLEEYLGYFLAHSQDEMVEVISGVTTHTTHFFREPKHFEFLQREALPKILSDRRAIRVWSAACSTGQEPVSIAICLDELARGRPATAFSAAIPTFSWSVLATDLDSQSLKVASRAIYSAHELEGIPRKQLVDNFDPGTGELLGWWRLKDELFRQIQFQQWNLLDPVTPVREVDILFLRNVLIYFRQEEITSVLAKLGDCLAPGGYLFVGHSESFVALGHSLELVAAGVYRKSKGR
jgi:chemotaxis protein methyltransferase CheR